MTSAPFRRLLVNGLSLALLALLAGCGQSETASPPPAAPSAVGDASLAGKIRASADKRREEADAARESAEKAQPEADGTVTLESDLPAGSDELDGGSAAATGGASSDLLSEADQRSFAKLAATLPGSEGVALTEARPGAAVVTVGDLQTGVAWSTAKVPVAIAAIKAGVADEGALTAAITASDNAAAERLWSALGQGEAAAKATDAELRRAGDPNTRTQPSSIRSGFTAFGQTEWTLSDQATFAAGMRCSEAGAKVFALMGQVISSQRWGLGSAGREASFKAGWGPGVSAGTGDGWLDRQFGVMRVGEGEVAVAIASSAPEHGAGTSALTTIAKWVVEHVGSRGLSPASC